MRKFFKQLQVELAFIYKNWLFSAAPLFYLLAIYLWLTNQVVNQEGKSFYQNASEYLSIGHTLSLGVIFLASVLAIRREKQTVLLDWTNSLPNSFLSIMLAKYIAINLYSMIFTVFFAVTFIGVGFVFEQPSSYLLEHVLSLSIQGQLSYFVSSSLGMILAIFIPNRIVYIIVFCAWMFGTFFMEGYIIQRYNLYFLKTFHLNQFFINDYHSDGWVYTLQKKEKLLSQLFVFFFSLLLLIITIAKSSVNRISSHHVRVWISVGLIFTLTAASFLPYYSFWKERSEHYQTLRASAVYQESIQAPEFNDVTNYSIEAAQMSNSRINFQSQLEIPAFSGEEMIFTLYPAFKIESIAWNGKPIDFIRDRHRVILSNLDQTDVNRLTVDYSGSLNEWGYVFSREKNFTFLCEDDMFLPSYIAWYPILADYPIYVRYADEFVDYFHNALYNTRTYGFYDKIPAANFHIVMKGFKQQVFSTSQEKRTLPDGTQIFNSTAAKGVTLLAHKGLKEIDSFPVQIISKHEHVDELEMHLSKLQGLEDYFPRWITNDLFQNVKLVYLPSLPFVGIDTYDLTNIDEGLFFDERNRRIIYYGNDQLIDNTMDDLKAQLLYYFLFGPNYRSSIYYNEDSVIDAVAQSILLVTYKEFYQYDWEDFEIFNGTSSVSLLAGLGHLQWMTPDDIPTTVEKLEYLIELNPEYHNEIIIYMVAKEIEEGNIDQIKELLAAVYDDIRSNNRTNYSYEEWSEQWNTIIENR